VFGVGLPASVASSSVSASDTTTMMPTSANTIALPEIAQGTHARRTGGGGRRSIDSTMTTGTVREAPTALGSVAGSDACEPVHDELEVMAPALTSDSYCPVDICPTPECEPVRVAT
jgi:hypothetical protein